MGLWAGLRFWRAEFKCQVRTDPLGHAPGRQPRKAFGLGCQIMHMRLSPIGPARSRVVIGRLGVILHHSREDFHMAQGLFPGFIIKKFDQDLDPIRV